MQLVPAIYQFHRLATNTDALKIDERLQMHEIHVYKRNSLKCLAAYLYFIIKIQTMIIVLLPLSMILVI
jgi:hypothetical protein